MPRSTGRIEETILLLLKREYPGKNADEVEFIDFFNNPNVLQNQVMSTVRNLLWDLFQGEKVSKAITHIHAYERRKSRQRKGGANDVDVP